MARIELRLYAGLHQRVREAEAGAIRVLAVKEGTTLAELLDSLAIPREAVALSFVNGLARPLDHALREGDRVGLFPPVGGG